MAGSRGYNPSVMKETLRALWYDVGNSLRDLTPIILVITGFQVLVLGQPLATLAPLAQGAVFVISGLTFFVYGLKLALFPIGESVAHSLASKGSVAWLLVFAFLLGFGTTFAEPTLIAIADEAARVAAQESALDGQDASLASYAFGLRLTVAISVGLALVLGVLRIVAGWSLPVMIITGYLLVVVVTLFAPKEIVGIAYDSGGVTTSTVTVPLVAALGIGLASSLRDRNPMSDGFGLIAFASLLPIIFVMGYGMLYSWN
jgi:hypothetical protein